MLFIRKFLVSLERRAHVGRVVLPRWGGGVCVPGLGWPSRGLVMVSSPGSLWSPDAEGRDHTLKGISLLLDNCPNAMTGYFFVFLVLLKMHVNQTIDFKGANGNCFPALCLSWSTLNGYRGSATQLKDRWYLILLEAVHSWGGAQNILLRGNPEIHRHLKGNKTCWFLFMVYLIWKYFTLETWKQSFICPWQTAASPKQSVCQTKKKMTLTQMWQVWQSRPGRNCLLYSLGMEFLTIHSNRMGIWVENKSFKFWKWDTGWCCCITCPCCRGVFSWLVYTQYLMVGGRALVKTGIKRE